MAGRGPTPKDPGQRRRRNAVPPIETIQPDGQLRGPDLPDTHEWPAATLNWWHTWRSSAQAAKFTSTDWDFLLDTAMLHAEFWLGNLTVAAELRLRAAKFGATPEDRARLRVQIGDPDGADTAPKRPGRVKTTEPGRRQRLLRAVSD